MLALRFTVWFLLAGLLPRVPLLLLVVLPEADALLVLAAVATALLLPLGRGGVGTVGAPAEAPAEAEAAGELLWKVLPPLCFRRLVLGMAGELEKSKISPKRTI